MKICPACNQTYTDENLNFCLTDGSLLTETADDAPPTVMLNQARTTAPNWNDYQAPPQPPQQAWGNQPLAAQQPFAPAVAIQRTDQTLAIVSLCLGIASVTVGWCCSSGLLLSPAALITGFIALSQIKKNPHLSGGRGLAIGGIVTATIYLAVLVLIIIIYGVAFLVGGIK